MLQPGDRAKICGLQNRPELNGCDVQLLQCLGERWAVLCPSGKMLKVKPSNLIQSASANALQAFASRLRLLGADEYSPFEAHSLLQASASELQVKVVDRSDQLVLGASGLGAVMPPALRLIATLLSEAERSLVFAQRTPENTTGFAAAFALMKHGSAIGASEADAEIPLALPGWLAWHRDDYFFASPAYDLALSRRVLCDFARGGGECCICLEPICASGPSTGLECGHIIHEQCLRRCLETPAPSCPLCREPIRSKRPSAIQYAAQQQQQVVAPQAAEVAAATAWPATVEQEEEPSGCRCC